MSRTDERRETKRGEGGGGERIKKLKKRSEGKDIYYC